ncbi:MAG: HAMP domain-containing histidine kinase [Krumholzibacteria bacterium]|nr:HAMP domain-containing histidine kinase [Candidatus Krumholzibacteria bacterium]
MLVVPVTFVNATSAGAVNLYWNEKVRADEARFGSVAEMATAIPEVYEAIANRCGMKMLDNIYAAVRCLHSNPGQQPPSHRTARLQLGECCDIIARVTRAYEVSVFLEDRTATPGSAVLLASTEKNRQLFRTKAYSVDGDLASLTGTVLQTRTATRHFDLRDLGKGELEAEKRWLWSDSLRIERRMMRELGIRKRSLLPPISWMGVPLAAAGNTIGIVRVCGAKSAPYFFSDAELNLVRRAAHAIGEAWAQYLEWQRLIADYRSRRTLDAHLAIANRDLVVVPAAGILDRKEIYRRLVATALKCISEAHVAGVRLLGTGGTELYPFVWETLDSKEAKAAGIGYSQAGMERRNSHGRSSGLYALKHGKAKRTSGEQARLGVEDRMVTGAVQIVSAPIYSLSAPVGVVDILGRERVPLGPGTEAVAESVAQTVGLYHAIVDIQSRLATSSRIQARIVVDFGHQLKSPVAALCSWIEELKYEIDKYELGELKKIQQILAGVGNKARSVCLGLRTFEILERGEVLVPKIEEIREYDLKALLIQVAMDNQVFVRRKKSVRISVADTGLRFFRRKGLLADIGLVTQALHNIVDNAVKYSKPGAHIVIDCGVTRSDSRFLSVRNFGRAIRGKDVPNCIKRGWRGVADDDPTHPGQGLGLWIVDNIMKAHSGSLVINPTTKEGETVVQLVFSGENAL